MTCNRVDRDPFCGSLAPRATHRFNAVNSVLGWIDATHILVDLDANRLDIVDANTGAFTPVPISDAGGMAMPSRLPGAL